MRKIIYALYLLAARLMATLYGAEGLNPILAIAPMSVINQILNRYGAQVHPTVRIKAPLIIHNGGTEKGQYFKNLRIDAQVFIGREALLDLEAPLHIGEKACISHGLKVMTHTDGADSHPTQSGILPTSAAPVTLEKGVYIGAYVLILQGVTIREGALVGANSLVTKDLDSFGIYRGQPARLIKKYSA
jgi:acetyltransferase-like isoleucine patch superfamily enzyme